jgi:hypothetical protein
MNLLFQGMPGLLGFQIKFCHGLTTFAQFLAQLFAAAVFQPLAQQLVNDGATLAWLHDLLKARHSFGRQRIRSFG